jgi:tyrosinase
MVTKRTFLKSATTLGFLTVFSGTVPGLRAFAKNGLRVRRSVNTMNPDDPDIATYRDFVGIMRAKPQTDKVSWLGFASQHGTAEEFVYCPHGDWYFLPWHRSFVLMYEKAAAALTHNTGFAMPYWDWTTLRDYPSTFTDKTYKGKDNPLYVPGLGDDPSMVRNSLTGPYALTNSLVGPQVMKKIYAETVYESFGTSRSVDRSDPKHPIVQDNLDAKWVPMGGGAQGILERTPHNNVHNNIGGFMPNKNSPRDPIFMMHHGNIDRIWAHWTALGRKNSTDPLWLNMAFTNNFIAADGTFYTTVVKDVQDTAALGYTYDDMPAPDFLVSDKKRNQNLAALFNPNESARPTRVSQSDKSLNKLDMELAVPFVMKKGQLDNILASAPIKTKPREVVAIISDIQMGDNVLAIRVFVNRDTVNQDVPDTDPHFVTTISFLNHHSASHAHALPSTIVSLTDALRGLAKGSQLANDTIAVQLLPVPKPGVPADQVKNIVPASIEIAFL